MNIFIDESGIHKSVDYSTIVVVYVEVKDIRKLEIDILNIEKELRLKTFHWSDERWLIRNKFLKQIIKLNFKFKLAIFRNPFSSQKMLEVVFQHLIIEKSLNGIFIDGEKPRWYEHKLKKVLRDKGISIKKLRTVRSISHPGIQLADALAGLTRYYFDNPKAEDAKKWFEKLKEKKKLVAQFIFESQALKNLA